MVLMVFVELENFAFQFDRDCLDKSQLPRGWLTAGDVAKNPPPPPPPLAGQVDESIHRVVKSSGTCDPFTSA